MFFLRNLNNECITVVLWDTVDGTPNFTKNILLGTESGRVYETALERNTKAFRVRARAACGVPIGRASCCRHAGDVVLLPAGAGAGAGASSSPSSSSTLEFVCFAVFHSSVVVGFC
jgi:hypothetical protein